MPLHTGRQGSSLAAAASAAQGIPEMAVPSGPLAALETLLINLRQGGQIDEQALMQILALLTGGQGLPLGGQAAPVDPIMAALGGGGAAI